MRCKASEERLTVNDINSLSLLCANIRSLVPKLADVTDTMSVTERDTIAMTEAWLTPQISGTSNNLEAVAKSIRSGNSIQE